MGAFGSFLTDISGPVWTDARADGIYGCGSLAAVCVYFGVGVGFLLRAINHLSYVDAAGRGGGLVDDAPIVLLSGGYK